MSLWIIFGDSIDFSYFLGSCSDAQIAIPILEFLLRYINLTFFTKLFFTQIILYTKSLWNLYWERVRSIGIDL